MADVLRLTVIHRDRAAFTGARYALYQLGGTPSLQDVDPQGQATLSFNDVAETKYRLLVTHAASNGPATASPRWEQNPTAFWPVELDIDYDPASNLKFFVHWKPEVTYRTEARSSAGVLCDLEVRLYRVRLMEDVVERVMSRYQMLGEQIHYPHFPTSWQGLMKQAATTPLLDSATQKIQRIPYGGAAHTTGATLLEVALRKEANGDEERGTGPKCVGVHYPHEVGLDNPDVLLYYRPQPDQDFQGQKSWYTTFPDGNPTPAVLAREYLLNRWDPDPYSKAVYHFDWFFLRTFEHLIDPWTPNQYFAKGFIHQILTSDKKLVVVAPVPEVGIGGDGFGHAVEAPYIDELVGEVLSLLEVIHNDDWIGRAPAESGPRRAGVACFSNGGGPAATFVRSAQAATSANRFAGRLREFYVFDAPVIYGVAMIQATLDFIQANGQPDDFDLRVYTKWDYNHTHGLVHETAAHLPSEAWPEQMKGLQIHSAIPGTMLTHALRMGRFTQR